MVKTIVKVFRTNNAGSTNYYYISVEISFQNKTQSIRQSQTVCSLNPAQYAELLNGRIEVLANEIYECVLVK